MSRRDQIRALHTLLGAKECGELEPYINEGIQRLIAGERPEVKKVIQTCAVINPDKKALKAEENRRRALTTLLEAKDSGELEPYIEKGILLLKEEESPDIEEVDEAEETSRLSPEQQAELFSALENRFAEEPKHYRRAKGVNFAGVKAALEENPELMNSLLKMEETGGSPDVLLDSGNSYIFVDCSAESPARRSNLTYEEALKMAEEFGIEMLNHPNYRDFMSKGTFDRDTFSLIKVAWVERGLAVVGSDQLGATVIVSVSDEPKPYVGWRGWLEVPKEGLSESLKDKQKVNPHVKAFEEAAKSGKSRELSPKQKTELLLILERRFAEEPEHYKRPEGVKFTEVWAALEENPELMYSLFLMEKTGGEPDVITNEDDAFLFGDTSLESPERRYLNYYEATEMAKTMGVDMMRQYEFCKMQGWYTKEGHHGIKPGLCDRNSWSWIKTEDYAVEKGVGWDTSDAYYDGRTPLSPVRNARFRSQHGGWRGVLRVPKSKK